MRRGNHILARIILILFCVHAIMGSLMLLQISEVSIFQLSLLLLALVVIHGVLGLLSTITALKTGKRSGHWYLKENAAFWTKRISGLAILLLLVFHINAYTTSVNGKYFLKEFTFCKMAVQIAFILVIFIHLAVSIKSLLIAKGVIKFKEKMVDWMLVLSILMIFFVISVIVYYVQWQV